MILVITWPVERTPPRYTARIDREGQADFEADPDNSTKTCSISWSFLANAGLICNIIKRMNRKSRPAQN